MTKNEDIQEMDLSAEPIFDSPSPVPAVDSVAADFSLTLSTGINTRVSQIVKKAPLLLNFIKGTWCPFCQVHLHHLRNWQFSLKNPNITILVVSNEPIEIIKRWLLDNPVSFLFGSVTDPEVFKKYGVDINHHEFPRPATFLIEMEMRVRFAHTGARNESLKSKIDSA